MIKYQYTPNDYKLTSTIFKRRTHSEQLVDFQTQTFDNRTRLQSFARVFNASLLLVETRWQLSIGDNYAKKRLLVITSLESIFFHRIFVKQKITIRSIWENFISKIIVYELKLADIQFPKPQNILKFVLSVISLNLSEINCIL